MTNNPVWAEKYRPESLEDCILPQDLRKSVESIITSEKFTNFIFAGTSGIGKTTLAKVICKELGADYIILNGSMGGEESGISALRTRVVKFASTESIVSNTRKVVIFDEADYLSPLHVQPALRNFMEEYSEMCGFILTCNYPEKLLDAIHSRCAVINFDRYIKRDSREIWRSQIKRLLYILKSEGYEIEEETKKVVAKLLKRNLLDFRKSINEIQFFVSTHGRVTEEILGVTIGQPLDDLVSHLISKNWDAIVEWVYSRQNLGQEIYTQLYKELRSQIDNSSSLIRIVHKFDFESYNSFDKNLCFLACLHCIMTDLLD